MKKSINDIDYVINILKNAYKKSRAPSVTLVSRTTGNPFNVLLATLISLRTKDEVTLKASQRLFEKVKTFEDIYKMDQALIRNLIYPAGFYRTKAKRMKEIAGIIIGQLNGRIPDTIEDLLKLPGVGRKTANLVVSLGFNKPGMCVDTHVHRITNRIGWVKTRTPDQTEFALRELIPVKYWRNLNDYLVSYGQTVCTPVSPFCSLCRLNDVCPKINVGRSR